MENIADILQNLPNTLLGVVALGILILGGIAYSFFKDEHVLLKLLSFLIMVLGFGLLVYALFARNPADTINRPESEIGQISEEQTQQKEVSETPPNVSGECADSDLVCLTKKLEKADDY